VASCVIWLVYATNKSREGKGLIAGPSGFQIFALKLQTRLLFANRLEHPLLSITCSYLSAPRFAAARSKVVPGQSLNWVAFPVKIQGALRGHRCRGRIADCKG